MGPLDLEWVVADVPGEVEPQAANTAAAITNGIKSRTPIDEEALCFITRVWQRSPARLRHPATAPGIDQTKHASSSRRRGEAKETRRGRLEPAGAPVEVRQFGREVNVQPLAPPRARLGA